MRLDLYATPPRPWGIRQRTNDAIEMVDAEGRTIMRINRGDDLGQGIAELLRDLSNGDLR